jgi:hypothetical protein
MFPKSGRNLPASQLPTESEYMRLLREALRDELGGTRSATKTIMRWTGACDRTARNWMSGLGGPSGYHLLCLARESDAVLDVMLAVSGRQELALNADVHAIEVALAKASGALQVLRRQTLGTLSRPQAKLGS